MSVDISTVKNSGPSLSPLQVTKIRSAKSWQGLDLKALWAYRELIYFLVWRDLKVRYKQTALGVAWIVLQPLCSVAVFAVIFGMFAKLPSDGQPYYLHSFAAMLPWTLFSGAVNRAGTSVVGSSNLISKVYFPRLIIPISAAVSGLVDYAISFGVLLVIMVVTGHLPGIQILTIPVWAALVLLLGFAVGTGLSAVNVRYRDVGYMLNFMLQIWMYASPVAYSASLIPERWYGLYQLNPMVGLIQGTRWALLGTAGSMGIPWIPALVVTLLLLVGSCVFFRQTERSFADTI